MNSIYSYLKYHGDNSPNSSAITSTNKHGHYTTTTYAQLLDSVHNYAAFCQQCMDKGEVIPIFMRRSVDLVSLLLGIMAAGYCVAPLNNKLKSPQFTQIISSNSVSNTFIDNTCLLTLRGFTPASQQSFDCLLHWVDSDDAEEIHQALSDNIKECIRMEPLAVVNNADYCDSGVDFCGSDPGACLFTSGSTGAPKGVLISHDDLLARALAEVEWFALSSDDVLLNILPFSFDVGFNQLLSSIVAGATLVISDSWLTTDIVNLAAEFDVTGISGVPAIWRNFIQSDTKFRHSCIRFITVSGGDLPQLYLKKLPDLAQGIEVFKTYGQTEAFRISSLKPGDFHRKMDSVGRAFGSGQFVVLREDGSLAKANELGEVVHMGLGSMLGYLNDLESDSSGNDNLDSDKKLRKNPCHQFASRYPLALFTGDSGYIDHDGFLFLKGRRDHMLKIQGNRVYPTEITSQIMMLEGVKQAEVVGCVDEKGDAVLVAFLIVECIDEPRFMNARQLRVLLSKKLPSYMVPKIIEIYTQMPTTATGKPDLHQLNLEAKRLVNA